MTANSMTFSTDAIEFGASVTLDPQWVVVFTGGGSIVSRWRDWEDGVVEGDIVWSTRDKPDETED